jgi:carbon storage regulator CsrA
MLILTLKENDKVFIGKEIRVMLVKIKGKQVQLGFEVPAEITVLREALALREHAEIVEKKGKASPKGMIQILEEEDPALADLIKKK